MATLTDAQVRELRRALTQGDFSCRWPKTTVNGIFQAIEDYFENTAKAGISTAINGVQAGLTAGEKKQFVRWYLQLKFGLEST